jgi:hypothetical protein
MKFQTRAFKNQDVQLDSNEYINCKFEDCKMIYGAKGLVTLKGCDFINVRWVFTDAASDTLQFLTHLYHGGGRQIVEQTFENIRTGTAPKL